MVGFRPGNESSSEFVIQLLNDTLHEGNEVFQLGIREHRIDDVFINRIRFILSATAMVTIEDDINDSKLFHLVMQL